ncbi:MAG: NPCBM/NEW2 domain-containing protein [Armatimonadota bacterium]
MSSYVYGADPYLLRIKDSKPAAASWAVNAFGKPGASPVLGPGIYIEKARNEVRLNTNVWNNPLLLGDKKYDHGIYMDSQAAIRIILDKPAVEFTADIGIDNNGSTQSAPHMGSARFHVIADNQTIFTSPIKRMPDGPQSIRVPLNNAKEFILEVDDADGDISYDQCDWADASVKLADGTILRLDELGIRTGISKRRLMVPFSFKYNGVSSDEFLDKWEFITRQKRIEGGRIKTNSYTDPATGLTIECQMKTWDDCAVVDWVFNLTNMGSTDSGLIEDFMPLDSDTLFAGMASGPVNIRWMNGDKTNYDSFLPHDEVLEKGKIRDFHSPISSNLVFPFFNIQGADGGWILAVGWTGKWKAEFLQNPDGGVTMRSGMEKTRFRLHPGEQVRTPSMVLLRWNGKEMIDGHNQFRRAVLSHYVQKIDGKPADCPIAHNTCGSIYEIAKETGTPLGRLNEAGELKTIDRIADLGCEYYWMDAYWYPQPWAENIGNWYPRPEDFPNGMRHLADAAHAKSMKFVLWMLPPAVSKDTLFAKQYPQYIHGGGDGNGGLWKMGDPEAREFMTKWVCDRMDEWDVDIYREDGSGIPAEEGPDDRVGIVEMKHFDGLYKFWSDVVDKSHAQLMDNCCGGGNRIDIETSRRSFYLWRSDFDDIIEGLKGKDYWPRMGRNDQVMIGGLNLYMPFHTGPVWDVTPYSIRSDMTTGIVFYGDIARKGFRDDLAKKGIAELKELRPFFHGDYYPLMKLTTDQDGWYAYQLDRPDLGKGCAFFFRRVDSSILAYEFNLYNIDPNATYKVSLTGETYDKARSKKMSGRDLQKLGVTIKEQPGSALLRYELIIEK